jgi:hypothetical protein
MMREGPGCRHLHNRPPAHNRPCRPRRSDSPAPPGARRAPRDPVTRIILVGFPSSRCSLANGNPNPRPQWPTNLTGCTGTPCPCSSPSSSPRSSPRSPVPPGRTLRLPPRPRHTHERTYIRSYTSWPPGRRVSDKPVSRPLHLPRTRRLPGPWHLSPSRHYTPLRRRRRDYYRSRLHPPAPRLWGPSAALPCPTPRT